MSRSSPTVLARSLLGVVVVAAVTSATSCVAREPAADPVIDRHTDSTQPSPPAYLSATPTPPPDTPTLPTAADGEDTRACADGTCEIRVTGPVTVPLPDEYGLRDIEVTEIDAPTVVMAAPADSSFGTSLDLTTQAGEERLVDNRMRLEVVAVAAHEAVIRIGPADSPIGDSG